MNARRALSALILFWLISAASDTARGFATLGSKWANGTVTMNLQLTPAGTLIDGSPSLDAVATEALSTWNRHIELVRFEAVPQSTRPQGDGDLINQVFFDSTYYGQAFGEKTLAITTRWTLNGSERVEADVVFNSAFDWNSYRGLLRSESGRTVWDFRRVALHEFGHVLGLDHPDEHGQRVHALMNSNLGDLDFLTDDDIAGASSLYRLDVVRPENTVTLQDRVDFVRRVEALYRFLSLLNGRWAQRAQEHWLAEYIRYRLSGCGHHEATKKVFQQVLGRGVQPPC